MSEEQIPLDFEGTDPEQILRRRWAENGRRERDFWTKDRLCLAWMQGSIPDESDMKWWQAQPGYQRTQWAYLHDKALQEARESRRAVRPYHLVQAEFDEACEIRARGDEKMIERFQEIVMDDFKAGRGCSIDLTCCDNSQRWRSEYCLDEAIRRAGIPAACVGALPPP